MPMSNKITVNIRELDDFEDRKIDALTDLAKVFKKYDLCILDNKAVIGESHRMECYGLFDILEDILEIHRSRVSYEGDFYLDVGNEEG